MTAIEPPTVRFPRARRAFSRRRLRAADPSAGHSSSPVVGRHGQRHADREDLLEPMRALHRLCTSLLCARYTAKGFSQNGQKVISRKRLASSSAAWTVRGRTLHSLRQRGKQ
ncbi:MAG TPA: hypothetical protein VOA41_11340 [Candidatus Dormibacteraeota bacterium]|nr:hypothetical protein [Candidatus Dormibacteraeota bacterium]